MKKLALVIAAAGALVGCATQPSIQQLRAQAPSQSDFEVCRAAALGGPQLSAVAAEEMQRRSLDCSPYMTVIQTQAQAQANRSAMALQLMQMNQPRQPINCISNRMGTSAIMNCN